MCSPRKIWPPISIRTWPSATDSPVSRFTDALSAISTVSPVFTLEYLTPMLMPVMGPVIVISRKVPGCCWWARRERFRRATIASQDDCSCARAEREKIAAKKISAAMAGNCLIRRGQLNRTNRRCQADSRRAQSGCGIKRFTHELKMMDTDQAWPGLQFQNPCSSVVQIKTAERSDSRKPVSRERADRSETRRWHDHRHARAQSTQTRPRELQFRVIAGGHLRSVRFHSQGPRFENVRRGYINQHRRDVCRLGFGCHRIIK